MTKFFTLIFVLCAIYVCVETKPVILDKLQDTLSTVTCVVGIAKYSTTTPPTQPEPSVNTNNDGGEASTGAPDGLREYVVRVGSCQAGYRMDRTGTCRKIA